MSDFWLSSGFGLSHDFWLSRDFWLNHQSGILFFLGLVCLISLSNLVFLRRLERYPPPGHRPMLSVLVPARNEQPNIERCVRSLLGQKYPHFEVIVLDDHSEDATPDILARLAADDPRLRVMHGQALPEGWLGKPWACHQLGEAAQGELLLFVDADTSLHPLCLRNAVSAMQAEHADLVSAIPHEETVTWGERLAVPLLPWSMHTFLPVGLAHRLPSPALSFGVGQFMLFRRAAYARIGGYAAVKDDLADDSAMARQVKACGLRWRLLDGSRRISCRMYRSFQESAMGFGKSLFATFNYRLLPFLFVWAWLGVVFLEPPVVLLLKATGLPLESFSAARAGAAVLLSLLVWSIPLLRFRFPWWLAFLYPAVALVTVGLSFVSLYQAVTGRATWKGRVVSGRKMKFV